MSVSKDVIKQCLINKQREVDEAVIVNRPVEFEENGNYVIKEFRISDPIQIALILLDLLLNIEILQVTHVMDWVFHA